MTRRKLFAALFAPAVAPEVARPAAAPPLAVSAELAEDVRSLPPGTEMAFPPYRRVLIAADAKAGRFIVGGKLVVERMTAVRR